MKLLILSDIHANVTAFDAVMANVKQNYGEELPIVILGDNIGYGMRPNETLSRISALEKRISVNLSGNHERAVLGFDEGRFSTQRGKDSCQYTRKLLEPKWLEYITKALRPGPVELSINGCRLLCVHGDLNDPFWGKMPSSEMMRDIYCKFDYVISGHSHVPVMKQEFYPDSSSRSRRNKVKVVFVNPGSIGQPRNNNTSAQFAIIDFATGSVYFNAVPYDIEAETILYNGEIDYFYRDRLKLGV